MKIEQILGQWYYYEHEGPVRAGECNLCHLCDPQDKDKGTKGYMIVAEFKTATMCAACKTKVPQEVLDVANLIGIGVNRYKYA